MDFLTSGQKIKKIRNELNLTQQELKESGITRNYISMIECDKRKLNLNIANKLLRVFLKKAEELNIDMELSLRYLLLQPNQEAEEYCREELKKEINKDKVNEIIQICNKYSLRDVLKEAYFKKANLLYKDEDFNFAFDNYFEALSIAKELGLKEEYSCIYNKIGKCRYSSMDFENAILFFNRAYNYALLYKQEDVIYNSSFNLALCYSREGNQESALIFIKKHMDLCNKDERKTDYIYGIILEAICYKELGEFEKAIELYNSIINSFDDLNYNVLANIYNNLALLYLNMEQYNNSMSYFNKSQKIREENKDPLVCRTLIYKSEIYNKLNRYDDAIKTLNSGIEIAKENGNRNNMFEGYKLLEKNYKSKNDYVKLKELYQIMLKEFNNLENKKEIVNISVKLAHLYIKFGDINLCDKLLEKIIDLN